MSNTCHIAVSFFLTFLSINSTIAQGNKVKEIDSLMTLVHELGIFNGNVMVVEKGNSIYEQSFGYANGSKTVKLNSDYRFNIGSISKEFNAVGIMMLKDQSKLKLEDKVSNYIDSLPNWADKITILNLLQYTSGLPDISWKTIKNDADIFRDLKQVKALNFEPGTNYAYNNSNVFLLRRIIEKISGMSFNKFVDTYLLQPSGMTASIVDPDLKGTNVAISFKDDFQEDPRQFSYVMTGWTSVTAQDLYKWTKYLHNYKLINKDSFARILMPVSPNKQSGLGGGKMENGNIIEHTHHGSSFDFEAVMYTEPSADNAVILLTNNMNSKLFDIKEAIKSILDGKPYRIPKKSLLKAFKPKLNEFSGDALVAFYNDLKANQTNNFDFDSESELNAIGYQLMASKRFNDAVIIFELNVKMFPNSANAFDSLGEAFYKKGDSKAALISYKRSLELNGDNPGARKIVAELENSK